MNYLRYTNYIIPLLCSFIGPINNFHLIRKKKNMNFKKKEIRPKIEIHYMKIVEKNFFFNVSTKEQDSSQIDNS